MLHDVDGTLRLILEHLKCNNIYTENIIWELKKSNLGDRGLFANRDIEAGEIIFRDSPLIMGPRANKNSPAVCVSCYRSDNIKSCSKECGLPVCCEECENNVIHSSECAVIRSWKNGKNFSKWSPTLLQSLTPVRSLFLNPSQKDLVKHLKAHQGPPHGAEVDIMKKVLSFRIKPKDEGYMKLVCAVMDANAFEMFAGTESNRRSSLRGLYPLSALMNHDCVSNTTHVFDSKHNMIVKATVFIPKGTELLHCYTRLFWGTQIRRHKLLTTKHFSCMCCRCRDPSESGTYINAVKCPQCSGLLLPSDPLETKSSWTCNSCQNELTSSQVYNVISLLGTIVSSFGPEHINEMLKFWKQKLPMFVPENNQIAVEVKLKLAWALGCHDGFLWSELTDELLLEKNFICRDLLGLLEALGAGQCKMRGLLLYELVCSLRECEGRNLLHHDGSQVCKGNEKDILFEEAKNILKDDVTAPTEIKFCYTNEE